MGPPVGCGAAALLSTGPAPQLVRFSIDSPNVAVSPVGVPGAS